MKMQFLLAMQSSTKMTLLLLCSSFVDAKLANNEELKD
jgi:hypothetical protein